MRRIALFGEDSAHETIIEALVRRLAGDFEIRVELDWRNARHGHGMVVKELEQYLKDLKAQSRQLPDLIIVVTDANCKGFNSSVRQLRDLEAPEPIIYAVPDPHIERWLLLDSKAFKDVVGRGCNAPDQKCDRERYKRLLRDAVLSAETKPVFGGIEFAKDIIERMHIGRASRADRSFKNFVEDLRRAFRGWQT